MNASFKKASKSRKKQLGVSLLQILLATVIGAVLTIAAIRLAQGQRAETEFQRGFELISSDVPTTLTNVYYSSGQTYGSITANAAGRDVITQRGGVDSKMPWSDTGVNWGVGVAGTTTGVTINYPCNNIGKDGATAVTKCTSLWNAINTQVTAGTNPLITAAPQYFVATALDPSGQAPTATAPTAAQLTSATASAGIAVSYARPR